jgi:D-3-phosphoglycerate dehydrogenase
VAGSRPRVAISDFDYGDNEVERAIVEGAGFELVALQARSEEELIEGARGCAAIMNQYAYVGAGTRGGVPRRGHLARDGIGVDLGDVVAATTRGVLVTNVRDYCTEEVADHAMAMMLTLARRLAQYNTATHAGDWHWQAARPIHRLRGSVLGIISFGRIGRAIAERARPFGVEILVYDPFVEEGLLRAAGVSRASKEELVERADYVMMQAPLTRETRHFIGEPELRRMKPRTIIVNTGRGPTIDNQALYRALKEGWIAGAALDDTEEEPAHRRTWSPDANPLFTLDNVLITPHSAYYSEESIRMCREVAASEVVRVLKGERPHNPVNNVKLADGTWSLAE